jgi:hypothetical protein
MMSYERFIVSPIGRKLVCVGRHNLRGKKVDKPFF